MGEEQSLWTLHAGSPESQEFNGRNQDLYHRLDREHASMRLHLSIWLTL